MFSLGVLVILVTICYHYHSATPKNRKAVQAKMNRPVRTLLSLLLSAAMLTGSARAVLGTLAYLLGLAGFGLTLFLGRHHLSKLALAALALPLLFAPAAALALTGSVGRAFAVLLNIPTLFCLAQLLVSDFLFSFKPNLDFKVCSKMGSGVIHLRCEPGGFAGLGAMINAAYVGYNEVLPAKDTDRAITEIGAILSDVQKLGDFAIEKWKED